MRLAAAMLLGSLVVPGLVAADGHVVPSERCRGLWIVPLSFGERSDETLQMVFDTGAASTSIDPQSLERSHGRRVKAGKKVRLREVHVGPATVDRLTATVHDMDHLSRALGRPIDGILGHPTFRSVLLTLDYPAGEIHVAEGSLPEPDGETIFGDIGKKRPFLPVSFGGARLPILVDSGSLSALTVRASDELEWEAEPVLHSAAVRYSGIRIEKAGRLAADVPFGPLTLERPIVDVTPGDDTRLAGYPILKRFVWTFDQRAKRIRMIADGDEPLRSEPTAITGVAYRPLEAGLEVARVFDRSPAERAGLREGDLVVAIDGTPVYERGCDGIVPPKAGVPIRLSILRGEQARELTVVPRVVVP